MRKPLEQHLGHEPPAETNGRPKLYTPPKNAVLCYGELSRHHKVIGEMIRDLPIDPDDFHGDCQVMRSTLFNMQQLVDKLIDYSQELK